MASQDHRLPSLDGLRAVSILMVLGGHVTAFGPAPLFDPVAPLFRADLGVRIFFVISGFLISFLLLNEWASSASGVSLRNFYIRRCLRLVPVQLAFILALFLLTMTTGLRLDACHFITALTYTKNYACGAWVDGHLWSLSVEEQFYLLWPVVLTRVPRKLALSVAVVFICLSPLSRAVEYLGGARGFYWLTSNSDALMIGCIAAIAVRAWPDKVRRIVAWRPAWGRAAAVAAMAIPFALSDRLLLGWFTVTLGPLIQALAAGYLVCSFVLHRQGVGYRLLNLKPVAFIGVLSYSLYIWQQPFFGTPAIFGVPSSIFLTFPFNLISLFAVSLLSYWLLERPLAKLRIQFRARPAQPAGAAKGFAGI